MQLSRLLYGAALALFLLSITPDKASAQNEIKTAPVYVGYAYRIHSNILNKDRDILVYLPRDIDSGKRKYPVLYITDGSSNFHHASGVLSFLSNCDHIPPMIMVAIPHHSRDKDMAPEFKEDYKPKYQEYEGEADQFLQFIKAELIPYIDNKYPTSPYRIYCGHSLGGNFGVYSMYTMPELFNAYIIISPALDWQDNILIKDSRKFLKVKQSLNKFMYLTMGDEGNSMLEPMQRYVEILASDAPPDFVWKYKYMRGESHNSTPLLSLYDGLELLFRDWRPSLELQQKGLSAIENHFTEVSAKFGFTVTPPEKMLNLMGYRMLNDGKLEEAIRIFKRNVDLYPGSANVYDSLGDAYYEFRKYELAAQNYAKAVEKAARNDDPSFRIYKTNLDRVKAILND